MEYGAGTSGGLPLEQYNRSVPPGWRPGILHYPFRRFIERLRLWYRQTDLDVSQCGPAVAGRLAGRPFSLAMALRVVRQDGTELRGDAALAYPGESATTHPTTGADIPATEPGL